MSSETNQSLQASEMVRWLTSEFQHTFDFISKPLAVRDKTITLLYIKTVVDGDQLHNLIIKPFFELPSMEDLGAYLTSLPSQQDVQSKEQVRQGLTSGSVAITYENTVLLFDLKKVNTDSALESSNEPTILGPDYSLSEDINTNINLIRQRYLQPSLTIEMTEIGEKSKQSLAILYDQDLVDEQVLKEIKEKLDTLDEAIIQSTPQLQRFLNDRKRSLVPIMMVTERTDRIIYNLSGGKVILLLDGSGFSVVAPAVFFDFMTSMEDNYHPFWISQFMRLLRYIGLVTCLAFPGLYVTVTSYNPDVFRASLIFSVAGSRMGVPYPSFIEVLFMLIVMELLTEASIRLPKAISATATTVGGLILGTAATEAALTSNIMIIIVSAVAISTFVIPINDMSFAIRVFRYVILLFATIAGMAGLILGMIGFVMYLTNKRSFGQPFLKLFITSKQVKGSKV